MNLVGETTMFFVGRKNTETEQHSLLRHNDYNGTFNAVDNFDSAKSFDTRKAAQQLAEMQQNMADLMSDSYEYNVVSSHTKTIRLDENGNEIPSETDESGDNSDDQTGDNTDQ